MKDVISGAINLKNFADGMRMKGEMAGRGSGVNCWVGDGEADLTKVWSCFEA